MKKVDLYCSNLILKNERSIKPNDLNKSSNMREKVKEIALKAINQEITQIEAEQQLLLLFNVSGSNSDEVNMPPLKKKRIYKILEADGNRCFYCGIETYPVNGERMYNSSTVDHVLPKTKGGIDHIDNCVNSCNNCNNLKGSDNLFPLTHCINACFNGVYTLLSSFLTVKLKL